MVFRFDASRYKQTHIRFNTRQWVIEFASTVSPPRYMTISLGLLGLVCKTISLYAMV